MGTEGDKIFQLVNNDIQAYALYDATTKELTLLSGSKVSARCSKTFTGSHKRQNMIKMYCSCSQGCIVTEENIVFSTPSSAASFCLGCAVNGWTAWKTTEGQTLDSFYRK